VCIFMEEIFLVHTTKLTGTEAFFFLICI